MALSFVAHCIRVILIVLNICFLAVGLGFLCAGLWLVIDSNALQVLRFSIGVVTTSDVIWIAAIIIIAIGALVILIAGFGFFGSVSTNACCLGCYSALLVILLLLQAAAVLLAGVFYSQIHKNMEKNLHETIQYRYGKENYSGTTKAWNVLQTQISCCGVDSALDWSNSWWKNQSKENVPEQCCVLVKKDSNDPKPVDPVQCQAAAYVENYPKRDLYINSKGCKQKIEDWVKSYFLIILSVVGGIFVLQVMTIGMACCLKSSAKNKAYERM